MRFASFWEAISSEWIMTDQFWCYDHNLSRFCNILKQQWYLFYSTCLKPFIHTRTLEFGAVFLVSSTGSNYVPKWYRIYITVSLFDCIFCFCIVFLISNRFISDDLVQFLSGLRIYFDAPHEFFGCNIKKLITETFVKQLYLKREKVVSDLETEIK